MDVCNLSTPACRLVDAARPASSKLGKCAGIHRAVYPRAAPRLFRIGAERAPRLLRARSEWAALAHVAEGVQSPPKEGLCREPYALASL